MADTASTGQPDAHEIPAEIADSTAQRLVPALVLAGLIVLAPLPFGSAHGWSLWLLQALSLAAAAFLLGCEGLDRVRGPMRPLLAPALLLLATVLLQLLPLPLAALDWASPSVASLDRDLVDSTGRWFSISINPHSSLVSLLRLLALAAAFVVVVSAPMPGRRSLFYWAIVLSGALAGASAWWHVLAGWDTLLFGEFGAYQPVASTPRLHWPLLNPNHLAAAMNVTWLVAIGAFLCPGMLGARDAARESQIHRSIGLFVALLAVSVLVGTRSRGGLASAIAGLAILALCWPVGRATPRRVVVVTRILAAAAVLMGFAWLVKKSLGGVDHSTVLAALARQDATLQVRAEIVRQGLRVVGDFAWLGTGLGTWGDAFPLYQRYPLLFATVTHAHCEPLEWLADLGAAGFAAICWLGATFVLHARGAGSEDAKRRRAVLTAALASLLVHAAGDFALRVPSIALLAATLLGLLWRETAPAAGDPGGRREPDRNGGLGVLDGLTVAACCAALVYLASWEWRDERWLASLAAKQSVTVPDSADWKVFEALSRRRAATGQSGFDSALRAVWAAPLSAHAHHALAYAYSSDEMRELELRRTVACQPSARFWRLEHALSLAALGQFPSARREIEEAFYFDPQYGEEGWLRFQDPIDQTWPFLEAALRGVRRRVADSPEAAGELRRFEALEEFLHRAYERKTHGQ